VDTKSVSYQETFSNIILSLEIKKHVSDSVTISEKRCYWGEMVIEWCLQITLAKKKMHRGIKTQVGDTLVKPISQQYIKLSVTNKNQGKPGTKTNSVKVMNCFPSLCEKKNAPFTLSTNTSNLLDLGSVKVA